jgi:hypothetical protein
MRIHDAEGFPPRLRHEQAAIICSKVNSRIKRSIAPFARTTPVTPTVRRFFVSHDVAQTEFLGQSLPQET